MHIMISVLGSKILLDLLMFGKKLQIGFGGFLTFLNFSVGGQPGRRLA